MDAGRQTPLASVLPGRKVLPVRICSDLALSSITPIPSSEFVAEDLPSLAKSPSASVTMPPSRYVTLRHVTLSRILARQLCRFISCAALPATLAPCLHTPDALKNARNDGMADDTSRVALV